MSSVSSFRVLSRGQLEALLRAVVKRHRLRSIHRYHPYPYQARIHNAIGRQRIVVFCGGNGVGKTTVIGAEVVAQVLGKRPWSGKAVGLPPRRILWAGPDFTVYHQEKSLPTLFSLMPEEAWEIRKNPQGVPTHLTHRETRSQVSIMSYEQHLRKAPHQVSPFESVDWDGAFLDEPPPYEVFVAVLRGITKRNGFLVLALTPLEEAWILDQLFLVAGAGPNATPDGDPNIYAEAIPMIAAVKGRENPRGHLTPEAYKVFADTVENTAEADARLRGQFATLQGVVYPIYDPMIHRFKPKDLIIQPDWPKGITVDPHDRRPFFMTWWAIDPSERILFFKEWPTNPLQEWTTCSYTWDDYAQFIRDEEKAIPGGPESVYFRLLDPKFGKQQKAAAKGEAKDLATFFAEEQLYFTTKFSESIPFGHAAVKRRLAWDKNEALSQTNRPTVLFSTDCWNLDWAIRRYSHAKASKKRADRTPPEDVQEVGKDPMDAVRYTVVFDPWFSVTKQQAPVAKVRTTGYVRGGRTRRSWTEVGSARS